MTSEYTEPILNELRDSFIETSGEKIGVLDSAISRLKEDYDGNQELMTDFRGQIHSLKGIGGTFGFPIITVICHRMEEYIEQDRAYTPDEFDDLQVYSDELRRMLEIGENPDEEATAEILSMLPTASENTATPSEPSEIEVVFISPTAALRQLAGFFLSDRNCAVTTTDDPFEAYQICVQMRPNLIISSVQMQKLNGIELLRSLRAISFLESSRFILLTSSSDVGELSAGLPDEIKCIRTDHMEDDINDLVDEIISSADTQ